jgi:high-affinity Fe2+/Pb2+ permease
METTANKKSAVKSVLILAGGVAFGMVVYAFVNKYALQKFNLV